MFSLCWLRSTTKTIGFTSLYSDTFPKVREHISNHWNQLLSWVELLLLLLIRNRPWYSFKKWRWRADCTIEFGRETCCAGWQPQAEVALSSLKTKLLRTRSIWSRTNEKKKNIHFRGYFDTSIWLLLNSGIKLMRLYWRTSYYISHTRVCQTWKNLMTFWIKLNEEVVKNSCTLVEKR